MRIIKILATLYAVSFSGIGMAQSTGGHGGHGGGNGGGGADCIKAKISRYTPEHLATVAPGSEFSFAASGSNGPGHIHVSIKQQPIAVTIQDKDTFYQVKGKLPKEIKNSVVRISVSLKSKVSRCDAEGGWLLKVSE
ncbi:hypothetical protein [Methylomonas methanica]|uniref:Uncharacterized protein n=1 Tax=Methylomonas methanica (strain DSM 25384 / MC09) TaxID=857087 RepID=G0A525_METMM|nr:hypothetical protein [Methylomonas methanica]AEF99188.1 hypothetical protein Metme_0747 [Methylomonas methanica MC09]